MDAIGQKLLKIAKSELGYHEKSSGYTKYGNWYGKHVDEDPYFKTAPWCDMFLAWAAHKAGVEDQAGEFASTPEHARWFKKHDAWGHKPKPGAIVFFSWSGGKSIGDIQHIGLVEEVDGDTLHTIEANHNNQLGRATRDVSQVVGYGYPSKVEVKGEASAGEKKASTDGHTAKHAAPPPAPGEVGMEVHRDTATTTSTSSEMPPVGRQAAMTGLLGVVVVGTVALAVARSKVRLPLPRPGVQLRKHGKHHRTPVELPAEVTPTHLDVAEAGTEAMPALSAQAAADAEEREFWGRIVEFEEDEELAFWDSLHAAMEPSGSLAEAPGH